MTIALHHYDHRSAPLWQVCGAGPKVLDPLGVQAYLKYDCGGKRFAPVSARVFDVLVDAVVRIRTSPP